MPEKGLFIAIPQSAVGIFGGFRPHLLYMVSPGGNESLHQATAVLEMLC
jgi:hypothetical protein